MALINKDGRYIKMYEYGMYEEFVSEEAREKVRRATPLEAIFAQYQLLLDKYDKEETIEDYKRIREEYDLYNGDYLDQNGARHEYPIMAEYFPDVKDSLYETVESGYVFYEEDNVKKVYEHAKASKLFGETRDA